MTSSSPSPLPRRVRVLYSAAQFALLIALLATGYYRMYTRVAGQSLQHQLVFARAFHILDGITRDYLDRMERLSALPAPDAATIAAMQDSAQRILGAPAGVFLWQDSTLRELRVPESLQEYAAELPRLLDPDKPPRERLRTDTVGSVIRWQDNLVLDSLRLTLHVFRRIEGTQGWGVFHDFNRVRRTQVLELGAYDKMNLLASPRWVQSLHWHDALHFRAFEGDTLLVQTADLDTTRAYYSEREFQRKGVRIDYYIDGRTQDFLNVFVKSRVHEVLLAVELGAMVVLWLFFRWLKRATVRREVAVREGVREG